MRTRVSMFQCQFHSNPKGCLIVVAPRLGFGARVSVLRLSLGEKKNRNPNTDTQTKLGGPCPGRNIRSLCPRAPEPRGPAPEASPPSPDPGPLRPSCSSHGKTKPENKIKPIAIHRNTLRIGTTTTFTFRHTRYQAGVRQSN